MRRGTSQLNRPSWSANTFVLGLGGGTLNFVEIFSADVEGRLNNFRGAQPTVLRIIINGEWRQASAGSSGIGYGVVKADIYGNPVAATQYDPSDPVSLQRDDWLYTNHVDQTISAASATGPHFHEFRQVHLDIRVKRKLDVNERLLFVAFNELNGEDIAGFFVCRVLSKANI